MAVLQSGFVAAEDQALVHAGLQVGLKARHERVILVAHGGVRVVEDCGRASGGGFVRQVSGVESWCTVTERPGTSDGYTRNSSPLAMVADSTMFGNSA